MVHVTTQAAAHALIALCNAPVANEIEADAKKKENNAKKTTPRLPGLPLIYSAHTHPHLMYNLPVTLPTLSMHRHLGQGPFPHQEGEKMILILILYRFFFGPHVFHSHFHLCNMVPRFKSPRGDPHCTAEMYEFSCAVCCAPFGTGFQPCTKVLSKVVGKEYADMQYAAVLPYQVLIVDSIADSTADFRRCAITLKALWGPFGVPLGAQLQGGCVPSTVGLGPTYCNHGHDPSSRFRSS